MAVYLVKDKYFQAKYHAVADTICFSVNDFVVDLCPASNCEESEKFCLDLKLFTGLNGLSLSEKMISVTFNESTKKIKVGGPFLNEILKGFTRKMKIQLDFMLRKGEEKFSVVSKELSIPVENPTENDYSYTFEDELEIFLWTKFYLIVASSSGTMTIKLLKCNTPSPPFPDVTAINKKILHDRIQCDFALLAKNGAPVSCHMSFLACHSQVFERMFQTDCKEVQEKSCPTSLCEAGVNALLKFLYYSDLDDARKSPSISLELLKTAHEYDMVTLEIAMKRLLLDKSNDWFELDMVLLLFQFALKVEGYQDLKGKAVKVIKSKSSILCESTVLDGIFKNDVVTAKELFLLVLNT